MKVLRLVYFEGCPNYPVVRDLLEKAKQSFEEIEQGRLFESDPLKRYSSPTVLFDSIIVIGGRISGSGCTLYIPSDTELNEKLSHCRRIHEDH